MIELKGALSIWIGIGIALLGSLACAMPALPSLAPEPTATVRPTRTPRPTFTATPTDTPVPTATATRTRTPIPPTPTPVPPTDTPVPTDTPLPTNTPRPRPPTATFTPAPPPPTPTPINPFTGRAGDISPASYTCGGNPFIAARVVDRGGNPLPGYYVHIGQDGNWSKWTSPTTATAKEPYGYNADFMVGAGKYYVTVFTEIIEPYNGGAAISNEVTVYLEDKDDEACSTSEGKNNGNKIRIAPVIFVYNR